MNILIDILPTTVDINNKIFKIDSNFRTAILFELAMQDEDFPKESLIQYALNLFYKKAIPQNLQKEAIEKILWFYKCGINDDLEEDSNNKSNFEKNGNLIYSFEYDQSYIYAAFLSQYNVDLQDIEYMHWWKFKSMFDSLKDDNLIVKIMDYRAKDLNSIEDKEEREHIKQMKERFKLPTKIDKEEEQRRKEIEDMLMNN